MEEGLAIQEPILGHLVGYYTTEIGPLNQVVHMWGYESLEDRAQRRAKLAADPEWGEFLKKQTPLIQRMENKILMPAKFMAKS